MSADPHAAPPLPLPGAGPGVPPDASRAADAADGGAPPAVVAQLLSTEHWSLLATRSVLWSELMSRIGIHLTVSSAALVVLALVAQATGFGPGFWVMAIGLASMLLVLGTLTLVRVTIGSQEDHRLIAGMNRLRGAYVGLAPGVGPAFLSGTSDDPDGIFATYALGLKRPMILHAISSTAFFLGCFNAMVAGALAALIAYVSGGSAVLVAVVGTAVGLAYIGAHTVISRAVFGFVTSDRGEGPPKGRVR